MAEISMKNKSREKVIKMRDERKVFIVVQLCVARIETLAEY